MVATPPSFQNAAILASPLILLPRVSLLSLKHYLKFGIGLLWFGANDGLIFLFLTPFFFVHQVWASSRADQPVFISRCINYALGINSENEKECVGIQSGANQSHHTTSF